MTRGALAGVCALLVLAAACSESETAAAPEPARAPPAAASVSPANTSKATPTPAPEPAGNGLDGADHDVAAAGATVGASSAEASHSGEGTPILRAVRAGTHDGLERLVFEFDGAGLPAWHIDYVDRPVRDCGSGDTVPVGGDAWLQVRFSGAHAHTEAGEGTSGPRRRSFDHALLRELVRTCDFEGEVTWVAGLARPNAYTTRVLSAPSRLVIDIAR